jgi:hypothetical protein
MQCRSERGVDVVIEQSDEEDLDDLVLDFLPSMMDVLARLSETHTFVQGGRFLSFLFIQIWDPLSRTAVFIPFHYAYKRERMGLDHDRFGARSSTTFKLPHSPRRKEKHLFEKMTKAVRPLLQSIVCLF